jgi:hypothetical protein
MHLSSADSNVIIILHIQQSDSGMFHRINLKPTIDLYSDVDGGGRALENRVLWHGLADLVK